MLVVFYRRLGITRSFIHQKW